LEALLAREDLLLGQTTLYNFVRVSHQLELRPADVIDRLTLTHHRALLPLPDPERKEELARRALALFFLGSIPTATTVSWAGY
jgi:hypothetical protein